MDDAKQSMHERFWELRKDWKLTLEQLEKQTGISKSALGSYEAEGTKDISRRNGFRGERQKNQP